MTKKIIALLLLASASLLGQTRVNGGFDFEEQVNCGTPAANGVRICNEAGALVATDENGVETILGAGGVGGTDFIGNHSAPTLRTIAAGAIPAITVSGAYAIDTDGGAQNNLSVIPCTAGTSGSFVAFNDARTVTFISSAIQTPFDSDVSLDQDGDRAFWVCPVTDTLQIFAFLDEDGKELYNPLEGGKAVSSTTIRPAGSLNIQATRHANQCGSLTDGLDGMKCYQESNHVEYHCLTADLLCDSWAEWFPAPDGAAGDIEVAFPQAPTFVDLSGDAGAFPAAVAYAISAQGVPGSTDNWTSGTCTTSFSVRRDNTDVITIVHASIPNPTGANIALNEDGDRAWMTCSVANTPVVSKFYDAATRTLYQNAASGTDDQTATEVPFTPYSTLSSTNVQTAIQELLDESAPSSAGITIITSAGPITKACAGEVPYTTFQTMTIPSGTIANGDTFVLEATVKNTCTTCTTDFHIIPFGGVHPTFSNMTNGFVSRLQYICDVYDAAAGDAVCTDFYMSGTSTDNDDVRDIIDFPNLTTTALNFELRVQQCVSGDTVLIPAVQIYKYNR